MKTRVRPGLVQVREVDAGGLGWRHAKEHRKPMKVSVGGGDRHRVGACER